MRISPIRSQRYDPVLTELRQQTRQLESWLHQFENEVEEHLLPHEEIVKKAEALGKKLLLLSQSLKERASALQMTCASLSTLNIPEDVKVMKWEHTTELKLEGHIERLYREFLSLFEKITGQR